MPIQKRWVVKPQGNSLTVEHIATSLRIAPVLANLLVQRGIDTVEKAKKFFNPRLEDLHNPFLMKDMERAVERVEEAVAKNQKIMVYGDYDVDGTTAVALVYKFLRHIGPFVFTELQIIDEQLSSAMRDMNELKFGLSVSKQQHAIMSMNNLALMLSESLNEMNSSMMEASGSCSKQKDSKKPNKGGKSMKNMKDLQEQLGKQLEQLREQMEKQKQGKGEPRSMSEEFARMAAQQEMLREEMQRILNEMKEDGIVGDDGINKIIKDMEKLEEDIVNKRITQQTINRNKDILSRMLKAENAQQEREKEEKRKSEEFKGSYEKRNIDDIEYQESIRKQQEFLKNNSIDYQPFYKSKINEYFLKKNN